MAYTRPPTFVNGGILGATQLNIFSDDLEYLYGVVSAPWIPAHSLVVTGDITHSTADNAWYIRHKYQYLHFCFRWVTGNDPTTLRIYYDYPTETTACLDTSDFTSLLDTTTYSGYSLYSSTTDAAVDLSNVTNFTEPTVGNWYNINIEVDTEAGDLWEVCYLIESDSSSLYPS